MRFALDSPSTTSGECVVRSPFVVSGWATSWSREATTIQVKIDGQLRASARTGLRRPDVADAFPEQPDALWSGFGTEVFADDLDGSMVTVAVNAAAIDGELPLARFLARIDGRDRVVSSRPRAWRFADILGCPLCLGDLVEAEGCWQCARCRSRFPERRGIPLFVRAGDVIESRLLETHATNPNAEDQAAIIMNQANRLVLDLGAGNPQASEHHPNVVFHEWAHYAHTDVVSVCRRLPYREGVFDAVISKATFEHLARPWEMADEIYRILKPGGLVHVDTAFMQPWHGDPHHFFNMTLDGVREIFSRFEPLRCGVKPYQTPAYAWRMQIDVLLQHLRSAEWRTRFQALRDDLAGDFDRALDAKGRDRLAAGVFFEGKKPAARHRAALCGMSVFDHQPWKDVPLARIASAPGMLAAEERRFLYFAAREFYVGAGAIVDAGAFLGASALALAAGLRDNPRVADTRRRIVSYDLFEFDDFYRSYLPATRLERGDDTRRLFEAFVEGFADQITAIKGDICQQAWSGGDVEILFVDFTQIWSQHEFVVRNFYAHMVPGRSLLVHQDYVHTLCYWLHVFMEYHRDSFELVSPLILNSTAAWLYVKPLPAEAFETPLNERLAFGDLLQLFDRSLTRYTGTAAGLLRCARGRMLLHALGPDRALEYATTLERDYAEDPTLLPHVAILRDEIGRWPRHDSPYDGFFKVS